MAISERDLYIIPFADADQVSAFCSASEDLNDFLKNEALNSQETLLSRTFLCFWQEHITGFLTLVADTIEVRSIDEDDGVNGYPYHKYPAVKIARLAVDKRFERQGIGRFLLLAAVGKVNQISKDIGCRYITLDAKRESIGFYLKCGFKPVKKYANRNFPPMYLNMYPVIIEMRSKDG